MNSQFHFVVAALSETGDVITSDYIYIFKNHITSFSSSGEETSWVRHLWEEKI